MKLGKTIVMELKNSWRGYFLFMVVVILISASFTQIYPSVAEAFGEDLDGAENVDVDVVDGSVFNLSWTQHPGAVNYTLFVGRSPQMIVPFRVERGIVDTQFTITLPLEVEKEWYFGVLAVVDDDEVREEFVGMDTNVERKSAIEEAIGIDYSDIRGFISVLWSMWWVLLIGLYIGYTSVNTISKDYEERRMDVILSKPISRRQYLFEKFTVISAFTLFLLVISALVTIVSVYSLGELDTLPASVLLLGTILSWPIFLVLIAVSFLFAIYFENSKKAVGVTFLVILLQFGVHLVGDMAEALEYVKPYTIISYWNHESILYGEGANWGDIAVLFFIAALLMLLAHYVFEKKDIPT